MNTGIKLLMCLLIQVHCQMQSKNLAIQNEQAQLDHPHITVSEGGSFEINCKSNEIIEVCSIKPPMNNTIVMFDGARYHNNNILGYKTDTNQCSVKVKNVTGKIHNGRWEYGIVVRFQETTEAFSKFVDVTIQNPPIDAELNIKNQVLQDSNQIKARDRKKLSLECVASPASEKLQMSTTLKVALFFTVVLFFIGVAGLSIFLIWLRVKGEEKLVFQLDPEGCSQNEKRDEANVDGLGKVNKGLPLDTSASGDTTNSKNQNVVPKRRDFSSFCNEHFRESSNNWTLSFGKAKKNYDINLLTPKSNSPHLIGFREEQLHEIMQQTDKNNQTSGQINTLCHDLPK